MSWQITSTDSVSQPTKKRYNMSQRKKIAAIIYGIIAVASLIMGSIYLFSNKFMPYHQEALETSWEDIDGRVQTLILALMTVAGGGWIALGIFTLTLILIPFRQNQIWASYLIPVSLLSFYFPTLMATLSVSENTPATPPWFATLITCLLTLLALIIDAPWRSR